MPSPIGHALAGVAIAWATTPARQPTATAEESRTLRSSLHWLPLWCAALATAPDLDLLVPQSHRTATHSISAVAIVTIVAIAVTGKVIRTRRWRAVLALVLAYGSHLLLDWLAADPTPPQGLQLLWPFSDHWFISSLDVFRGTARRNIFSARSMWINATALAQELAIFVPILWIIRRARKG